MGKRIVQLGLVACILSTAALLAAAEPEVVWPTEWTAFGPVPARYGGHYGFPPKPEDMPPAESLKVVPTELVLGKLTLKPWQLRLDGGRFDFAAKFSRVARGQGVHLWAIVEAAGDTNVRVAAGADWWMRWHLDGQVVFDTIDRGIIGNGSTPVTARDHEFDLQLSKGRHVLAVSVIGGNRGFLLAVTSPQELGEHPLSFRDAMAAGRRKYARPHWSIPLDLPAARADFQRALELAATDVEQADARLAIADSLRQDIIGRQGRNQVAWLSRAVQDTRPASGEPGYKDGQDNITSRHNDVAGAIRQQCLAVLALTNTTAGQKAQAALGLGEALLLENRCAEARQQFEKASGLAPRTDHALSAELAIARSHLQQGNYQVAQEKLDQFLKNDKLDHLFRFHARSLREAAAVAPRIRTDHPRLFFNTETWPALKARVPADGKSLADVRKLAAALPGQFTPDSFPTFRNNLMPAALAYRLTGDAALLAKIGRLLRAGTDFCLRRNWFNYHNPNWDLIVSMDWVWNDLPPSDRESLARDLLRYAYSRHMDDVSARLLKIDGYGHGYESAMYWYVGLLLANSGLGEVDNARALTLLGRGYDNHTHGEGGFDSRVAVTRDGSAWWSALDYGLSGYQQPLWAFMYCWQSAVGGKVPDEWAYIGISPEFVLRVALDIRSGAPASCMRDFGFSRSWRNSGGWAGYGQNVYSGLARFIHIFGKGHPQDAAVAAHLRRRLAQAGCSGDWIFPLEPLLLDVSTAAESKLPDELPLARHYNGNGLALMSSGFGPGATYVLFCCGRLDPERKIRDCSEHFDTTHFTIYKQGYLALDSGTRALGENPITKGNSGANYDRQSVAHNVVLIRMPGEDFGPDVESNSGGQRQRPNFAKPLAFESSPHFAYIATDATGTYHKEKCAEMVRQFIFLPSDHFVVFDRVVSKNADFPKAWLLHTANEPVIAGRELRADQDRGRIFCRTLLPADAVLDKIGGPGKEFWADGRNWPIPGDSSYLPSLRIKDSADVAENMGRWRVEVKPGAARTDDVFLHLIQASDQAVTKMVENKVAEQDGRIELSFVSGPRSYTIRLNKTGEIGGHLRIEDGGRVLDQELTRELQRQSGSVPTTSQNGQN
jgi:heparin/heparan-sulfate lyase